MKVLILGAAGIQGSATAYDLITREPSAQVVLAEPDADALTETLNWLDSDRASAISLDASDVDAIVDCIKSEGCDIIISSVPWPIAIPPLEAALDAKVHFIDYGLYQNRTFDDAWSHYCQRAEAAGITVIPSCGLAPGLTNLLAARGAYQLDETHRIRIYVGGLPEKPEPPLGYKAVWSLEGVWTQFFETCRVIRNGGIVETEAVTERETLDFTAVGSLEAALTDGLGTLLQMFHDPLFSGIQDAFEKSLRHEGHYDKVLTLKDCGLLDTEPIEINGIFLPPRQFLTALLGPKLTLGDDERDMTVLRVVVEGQKNKEEKTHIFEVVDYKDLTSGVLSMGRTTGFTGALLAPMVHNGIIHQTGMVTPEHLGAEPRLFDEMITAYSARGINVKIREV